MPTFNAYSTAENIRVAALLKEIHNQGMIPQIITREDGSESYKIFQKQVPYQPREKDKNVLKRGFKAVLKMFGKGHNEGIKVSRPSGLTGELQEIGEIHLRSNGEKDPFASPIESFKAADGFRQGVNEIMLKDVIKKAELIPFAPAFSNQEKKYARNFFAGAVLDGKQILLQDNDGSITNFKGVNPDYILTAMLKNNQKIIVADQNGHRVGSVNMVPQGRNGDPKAMFKEIEDEDVFYRGNIEKLRMEAIEDIEERRARLEREHNSEEGIVPKSVQKSNDAVIADIDEIAEAIKDADSSLLNNAERELESEIKEFDQSKGNFGSFIKD